MSNDPLKEMLEVAHALTDKLSEVDKETKEVRRDLNRMEVGLAELAIKQEINQELKHRLGQLENSKHEQSSAVAELGKSFAVLRAQLLTVGPIVVILATFFADAFLKYVIGG